MRSLAFLLRCMLGYLSLVPIDAGDWTNFVIFDGHYLPMAKCWYKWFRRNGGKNHLKVGCLDEASCQQALQWQSDQAPSTRRNMEVVNEMQIYDLDPVTAKVVYPLGGIDVWPRAKATRVTREAAQLLRHEVDEQWPRRKYIHLFHRMIWDTLQQRQEALLHLDVDALWLKPPDHRLKAILEAHPDVDIIASSSRESNPKDLVEKWGFVLNVGFIMFRYTEAVKLLFHEELLHAKEPSCQQLLNYALERKGCRWNGNDTAVSNQLGQCGELKLVALSQAFVSRSVDLLYDSENPSMPAIAHPDTGLLQLEGINRMRQFRDMNLC